MCTYVHVYPYTYKSAPNRVCGLINSQKLNVLVQPMAKSKPGTLGAPGSLSSCNLVTMCSGRVLETKIWALGVLVVTVSLLL